MIMEHIVSHGTKAANLPFSDAVRVGEVLYLSGQLGNVPGTRNLVPGGIAAETRNAQGLSFDNLIRCTVMLADMSQWAASNEIYVTYFKPGRLPVRSAFGTNGLALGAVVEMECTAWMGEK
jgi:2-iminobutanoate/2-iminopropanoate deaminase